MTEQELLARISAVLTETFNLPGEKVTAGARLRDDLELDSIDLFDLVGAVERELGVHLDVADFKGVDTLGSLAQRMHELLLRHTAAES